MFVGNNICITFADVNNKQIDLAATAIRHQYYEYTKFRIEECFTLLCFRNACILHAGGY